ERGEDPAEIAGVEPELLGQLRGDGVLAVRDLIEHACLGEGERCLEIAVAKETDLAGIEPAEAAHVGDTPIEGRCSLRCPYSAMLADVNNIVASVNRCARRAPARRLSPGARASCASPRAGTSRPPGG